MNILYTLNDQFSMQVATSICSLCENNKEQDKIHFYLFSSKVSSKNKRELTKLVTSYNRNITIIELDDIKKYFDFEFDTNGWRDIVIARLLLDKILPAKVKRILYLDGDTIVRNSLDSLWNLDMKDKIIGMIAEPTVNKERKEKLGLTNYAYCNSGVLLIDLDKYRKNKCGKKIMEFCKNNIKVIFAPDQDAINGALKDDIYLLSPKYNFFNVFYQYNYKFIKKLMKDIPYISEEEYIEARNNPCIIHYLGEERPWRLGCTHKYTKEFIYYLNKTKWKNTPFEEGWKLYFICFKIFNTVTKPMPSIRYKIMDYLIPKMIKYRANKIKKVG